MRGKWFFWLGFFLPVNGLFEAIFFLGRGYRPDLNQVLWLTATYQSLFFLCASYAVLSLRFVWDDLGDEANGKSWCYRFAGLISIGLLLFLHAGEVYRFGQFEHEVHRNMLIANRQLPAEQPGNVRAEPIKIQARVWTYSTSFNALTRQQIDSDSLTRKAREQVSGLHERVLDRTPTGRWGVTEDFAGIAVFLSSRASDFVTGTAIPVTKICTGPSRRFQGGGSSWCTPNGCWPPFAPRWRRRSTWAARRRSRWC